VEWPRLLRPSTWSYRAKVPFLITTVAVATALAISVAIAVSARNWLREDLHDHAAAVAQSLARGLVVHIARDDVWEAFEAVRAVASGDGGPPRCDVVVLDGNNLVFVSSDPLRFPVRSSDAVLTAPLRSAAQMSAKPGETSLSEFRTDDDAYATVSVPLLSADKEAVGKLLMSYSHAIFAQRYRDTVRTLAGITAVLVALLVPLGLWLGHRLANPLARVTDGLYRLGEEAAKKSATYSAETAQTVVAPHSSSNELGRLEHSLAHLQRQLHEKELLQKQFVAADRLAAIGRMTSGVAHEINNPLAGMLNALSNLRKDPSLLQRTVALMERGLEQIRQTLSALLIETKTTARPLSPSDIEDLRVLIQPQALNKRLRLDWHYPAESALAVPAAPVRQVVLNLLLNAVQAAESSLSFSATVLDAELTMTVANDGAAFPEALRRQPFEPVVGGEGYGLGLWATHQLVASLGGRITFASEAGRTVFEVHLPLNTAPNLALPSDQLVETTP
jgi:two-component system NtrC family sensor kinase